MNSRRRLEKTFIVLTLRMRENFDSFNSPAAYAAAKVSLIMIPESDNSLKWRVALE